MKNRIDELKREAGLSYRQLGEKINMTFSTIAQLASGKQTLRQHHIERLCSFFNCTADYLLGKSDDGIGVYFNDDCKMISRKKYLELINEYDYEVSIIALDIPSTTFRVWNREIYLSNLQVYRHIKVNSFEVEDVRSQLNDVLNNLSDKELRKVLNFINDYIK